MRLSTTFSALALLALSTCMYGQATSVPKIEMPGIPGYLDAKTGAFRPLRQEAPDASAVPNIANTTGKLVFTFTIAIQSSFPSSVPIACGATAFVYEGGIVPSFLDTAAVIANRSGSTATCTVNIPYSWALAQPSGDTLCFTIQATALTTTLPIIGRTDFQTLTPIRMPANGVTTTQAVSLTL